MIFTTCLFEARRAYIVAHTLTEVTPYFLQADIHVLCPMNTTMSLLKGIINCSKPEGHWPILCYTYILNMFQVPCRKYCLYWEQLLEITSQGSKLAGSQGSFHRYYDLGQVVKRRCEVISRTRPRVCQVRNGLLWRGINSLWTLIWDQQ